MRKAALRIFLVLIMVSMMVIGSTTGINAAKPFLRVGSVTANPGSNPEGSWDVSVSWSYKNVSCIQILIIHLKEGSSIVNTQGFSVPFPPDDIYRIENNNSADLGYAASSGSEKIEVALFSKTGRIIQFISQDIVY